MNQSGLCNTETKAGIFRKKSNTSRSRLSINQGSSNRQTSSCPSSPRQGMRLNNSTSSLTQYEQNAIVTSTALHRSASTMSSLRPRSSPSGLYSYTGKIEKIEFKMREWQKLKNHQFINKRFSTAVRAWLAY